MIKPLKTTWKIDEDAGFVRDQIKDRVNSESNYMWARKNELSKEERSIYYQKLGRDYLKSKQK